MAFDQSARNRLQRFVSDARGLIVEEFTRQLQAVYGIDPVTGEDAVLASLKGLDDGELETAVLLRETISHYRAGSPGGQAVEAIDRVIREQAFTVLNRLCALRMAEARGLLVECVAKGPRSSGFQMYARLAGPSLGEQMDAYRLYLFGIFDELCLDLAVLFDRHSPLGRLFPRTEVLAKLLELLADEELASFWSEDETIGWIYQYFNSKEERKRMRDESAAPRNSRELAVRNQFFTPRYVVEFLTDNTLGRIWYEMRKGETSLKESCRYLVRRPTEIFLAEGETAPEKNEPETDLSQEELLKSPVCIEHRPAKDPRDLKVLDPACGSGHFLLYAFDLLERIYEEGWELEAAPKSELTGRSLREDYPSLEELRPCIPKLIIEHNLHGIDIDPRCAQIAGLSLWLRAQKSWQAQSLKPAERPGIRKSNIVCAEPMPGEKELLCDFVEREFKASERAIFLRLLEGIWNKMQLAGEAGSLLKIEEEISGAIEEAKAAWQKAQGRSAELFSTSELNAARSQKEMDFSAEIGSLGADFFEGFEERVYAALSRYAEAVGNEKGFRRRLFAEDAARGFAFIDVSSKRFDVALMNPPFGDATPAALELVRKYYPEYAENLYVAFHYRSSEMLVRCGFVGIISSRTFITYRDFERFRSQLLGSSPLKMLADLGWEVLDSAQVETAAYVTTRDTLPNDWFGPFFRLLTVLVENKASELESFTSFSKTNRTFYIRSSSLQKLPGCPLCYWSSRQFFSVVSNSSCLYPDHAYVGLGASPHAFFFRAWWEVAVNSFENKWRRICRGGDYAPFYRSNALVINWHQNGGSVKEYILKKYPYLNGNFGWKIQDEGKYGQPGLTWGKRNERFNVQVMPSGHIFTDEGQGIIPVDSGQSMFLLGYMNSALVAYFLSLTSGLQKHYVYIRPIPVIQLPPKSIIAIQNAAMEVVELKQKWTSTSETSPLFTIPLPSDLNMQQGLRNSVIQCQIVWGKDSDSIAHSRDEINRVVFSGTALGEDDIMEINSLIATFPKDVPCIEGFVPTPDGTEIDFTKAEMSYIFGCFFGRWEIRYAMCEMSTPELPNPFEPLPICPPGMLQNAKGFPARPEDLPADYPLKDLPWDGILVDDPGHTRDIETRVREVLEVIWKERAEAIEREACQILGVKNLRDYFRKPSLFFADHLKRYSKSRRQAPIYWPLSTASGSYTLWIYYHRLSDQTLYTCVNNFVSPKIEELERQILTLKQDKKTAALAEAQDFLAELEEFRRELLEWAPKWKPNLNDGVLITASPLYKLFRLPKWRKDLEACWKALERGDYDWAYLAYSLWPERVRKVCVTDKSIAIAHGLEELYVEPVGAAKKKRAKKVVEEPELGENEE